MAPKNFLISFLALCLVVSQVLATSDAEAQGYWSIWQNKEDGSGVSYAAMNFPSQDSSISVSQSQGYQPLVADLDGDSRQDIVITSGASLYAYDIVSGAFYVKAQANMPASQTGKAAIIKDRDTGQYLLAMPASQYLLIYGLNASSWQLKRQVNVTAQNITFTNQGGLACTSQLSSTYGDTCFWGTTGRRWAEYHYKTDTTASYYIGDNINVSAPVFSNNFNGFQAAIGVQAGKVDVITPLTGVKVFQANACAGSLGNYFFMANSLGGQDLLYTVCGSVAGSCLQSWSSSGSSYKAFANTASNCNSGGGSSHFIVGGSFKNLGRQVCDVRQANAGGGFGDDIYCYNDTSTVVDAILTNKGSNGTAFAIDIGSDGFSELFDGLSFINLRTGKMVNLSVNTKGQVALSDINLDTNAEVIGSLSGKVWVSSSGAAGSASTAAAYEFTLNSRDLDRNFASPVCVNSSVTFTAANCRNLPLDLCNYALNATASQYLYTTCGTGSVIGPYTSGLAVAAAPSVSCFYSVPGTYSFNIYVTTVVTGSRPALDKFWPVQVWVNDTSTCNQQPFYGTIVRQQPYVPGNAVSSPGNAAKGFLETLFHGTGIGNTAIWLILMLAIGLIALFAASGSEFSGGAIMAVLACVEILMLFLGVSLGFIGTGIIISVTFLGTAVVVLWIRSAASGG